jgi:hypothetical protein
VSAPQGAGGRFGDDGVSGAEGTQVVTVRAEIAYRAFLDHVRECTAECNQVREDCRTAKVLREVWREA